MPSSVPLALACLALLAVPVHGATAAQAGGSVDALAYAGDTVPNTDGAVLWRDAAHAFTATVTSPETDYYTVCLSVRHGEASTPLGCSSAFVTGTEGVTVAVDSWPANATGRGTVVARLDGGSGSADTAALDVVVLVPGGDDDGDGLDNRREADVGTSPLRADTDGDGVTDAAEVDVHHTDPTAGDTDGDGLADGIEITQYGTNPTAGDTDGDGLADGAEVNTYGTDPTAPDTDDDGVADGAEVNEYGTNPTTPDTDRDGLADGAEVNVYGTDPTAPDTDDDGLADGAEVDRHANPRVSDTDRDGLADGAEVNVYGTDPTAPDTDDDGVADGEEVAEGTDPTSPPDVTDWVASFGVDWRLVAGGALAVALLVGGIVGASARPWRALGRDRSGNAAESDAAGVEAPVTDEQRVLHLLEANGGRLPQSRIVEETDWSKAKVSRVLSRMADEGTVDKIPLGRYNLITLPEAAPE